MANPALSVSKFTHLVGDHGLSPRSHYKMTTSEKWELIWEAADYYDRIAKTIEQGFSYAIFVGWQIDSRLELSAARHETFKQFVVRICEAKPDFHFYFLMWDFSFFYVFEREFLQRWIWDGIHERVHFVFDNRHPYGGAHHEKFVIVDGEAAFVGGVDICDDRWDSPAHRFHDSRRSLGHDHDAHDPYHDLSVEVRGEVAADLVEYIRSRWVALSTTAFPERPRQALSESRGCFRLAISRTRASVDLKAPVLIRETEFLFRDLIRATRYELVIENQYYWSRAVNDEICALMRARANTGLKIFLVVPSGRDGSLAFRLMGVTQTVLLQKLRETARDTGTRLVVGCPFSISDSDPSVEKSIYVHSKVLVVDDTHLALGSSNFNNRGFRLDTELTLTLLGDSVESRAVIRECARRIRTHWKGDGVYLKSYVPAWAPYFKTLEGRIAVALKRLHVPIERVFDPPMPFNYALKCRLATKSQARIRRRIPVLLFSVLSLGVGLSIFFFAYAGGVSVHAIDPPGVYLLLFYALLFSSSWLYPLPSSMVAACAGLQLGSAIAAPLVFYSSLVSSGLCYSFSRMFPTVAAKYYQRFFRMRSFLPKIAYQGILSVPVRRFMLMALGLSAAYAAVAFLFGLL